jgi:hypothetical protein
MSKNVKAEPYIGITGLASQEEVERVIAEFHQAGYTMNSPHLPMLGFLVSCESLSNPTLRPVNRRYPRFADVRDLLKQTGRRVFTMIHYESGLYALAEQVTRMFDRIYEEGLCRAIQLNIPWPNVSQVQLLKREFPELKIVFQLSHKSIEAMSDAPAKDIVDRLEDYGDSLSYVLIDPSAGRGKAFEIENSFELELYYGLSQLPYLTLGFAGGFTGDNVARRLEKIKAATGRTNFCIDAESGLRDQVTKAYGDDLLNIEKVKAYLQAAASVLP